MNAPLNPAVTAPRRTAAMHYASIGWPVFPAYSVVDALCTCGDPACKSKGKHPRTANGFKSATRTMSQIGGRDWEASNIGVATGTPSGMFALDIDPRNGGDDSLNDLEAANGKLPDTLTAKTGGGGRHFFFKMPRGVSIPCSANKVGPGIDIKGDLGYVIVAPSVTAGSYEWLDCDLPTVNEIVDAPEWLLQLITSKRPATPPQPIAAVAAAPAIVSVAAPAKVLSKDALEEIESALDFIKDWDDRDRWLQVGMALHSTNAGEVAFNLWADWSKQSDKYDPADLHRVWNSFKPREDGVGMGTIFKLATENDWQQSLVAGVDTSGILKQAQQAGQTVAIEAAPVEHPQMDSLGFHGILKNVVDAGTATSEASKIAVAANTIAYFCAMIGRNAYQEIGDSVVHCRPFFLLTGQSSKARKGTSESFPRKLFRRVDKILAERAAAGGNLGEANFWYLKERSGLSSGEGLAYQVRDESEKVDPKGIPMWDAVDDKRLLLIEPEFASVIASCRRETSTLSPTIRNAWDGKTLSTLNKNTPVTASAPHIVMVAHITGTELRKKIDSVEIGNGFLNRFVILHVSRDKLVPHPARTPDATVDDLAECLAGAVSFATASGKHNDTIACEMDDDARDYWSAIYPRLSKSLPGITGSLLGRSEVYCRMLAMVFALLDKTTTISAQHIKAAECWFDYGRQSIEYIFDETDRQVEFDENEALAKRVFEIIRDKPGITQTDINKGLSGHFTSEQIKAALEHHCVMRPHKFDRC